MNHTPLGTTLVVIPFQEDPFEVIRSALSGDLFVPSLRKLEVVEKSLIDFTLKYSLRLVLGVSIRRVSKDRVLLSNNRI